MNHLHLVTVASPLAGTKPGPESLLRLRMVLFRGLANCPESIGG